VKESSNREPARAAPRVGAFVRLLAFAAPAVALRSSSRTRETQLQASGE